MMMNTKFSKTKDMFRQFACALLFAFIFTSYSASATTTYIYGVTFRVFVDDIQQDLSGLFNEYGVMSNSVIDIDVVGGNQPNLSPTGFSINISMSCSEYCFELPDPFISFFLLIPDYFSAGSEMECWKWNDSCVDLDELFIYDSMTTATVDLFLNSMELPESEYDPVSARWNPEAGRRSGGELLWGPDYLTAKSQVTDVTSEAFPALLYSGASFEKQVDLAVAGRGLDFVFSRVHRSDIPDSGGEYFGGQWTHSYDIEMDSPNLLSGAAPAIVRLGNGQEVVFRQKYKDSSATPSYRYFYADGWDAELELTADAGNYTYRLKFGDGVIWTFETFYVTSAVTLHLVSVTDRFGNTIALAYDGEDRLVTITDTLGRVYELTYNITPANTIASLREVNGLGRIIAYSYPSGRLDSVTFPGVASINYTYDSSGHLLTITDPLNQTTLTNTYDLSTDKLLFQKFGQGEDIGTVAYEYIDASYLESGEVHAVRVTDGAGHVTEHYFNNRNQRVRLVRFVDDEEFVTRTTWSEHIFSPGYGVTAPDVSVSDDLPASVLLPDGTVINYHYAADEDNGLIDANYRYRMDTVKIERVANDDSRKIVEAIDCDRSTQGVLLDLWSARFGESFKTRYEVRDGQGFLLYGANYSYGDNVDDEGEGEENIEVVLAGIDYDGLDSYKALSASSVPGSVQAPETILGEGDITASLLGTADELYSVQALEMLATAESVYEPEPLLSVVVEAEVMAVATGRKDKADKQEKKEKKDKKDKDVPFPVSYDYHESFGYNGNGQITEHLHPDNDTDGDPVDTIRRLDKYVYTNGYLTTVTIDEGGADLTTTYGPDEVGRVTSIEDPNNNVTSITYDDLDQAIEVVLSAVTGGSPTTRYFYDANGNLEVTEADYFDETGGSPDIFSTVYVYDSRNRATEIKQETETGWNITRFTYDGNGNQIRVETPLAVAGDEPDNIVEYEYDARDLLVRVTQANTLVTLMDYDAAGRLIQQIEGYATPEARTWQYAYNGLGYLAVSTAPDGLETHYDRDVLGRVLMGSTYDGVNLLARTEYEYDLLGRAVKVEEMHRDANDAAVGDGISILEYVYTDAGNVSAEKIEEDIVSTYTYDTAMRAASVIAASGDVVAYTYDANSNVIRVLETAVNTTGGFEEFYTHYAYDALNRLVEVEPDGDDVPDSTRETVYAYDSLNRLVTETDALDRVTRNMYDPLGRVISTTHDEGGIGAAIEYAYDANSRLTEQRDAKNNTTQYAYDTLDRLRVITHPDGTTTQYTDYDVLGNLRTAVEPDGLVTNTDYDIMSRPVAQSFEHLAGRVDPGVTTWAYDALGRVIQAGNGVSTVTHTYDTLGNLQSETSEYGGDSRTINYQYDNRSLQKVLEVENSLRLDYTHDIVGRVRGIDQNALNIAGLEYLGGRMLQRNYGNGAAATVTYEPTGRRIEDITHTDVSAATVDTRTYAWDDVYNLDSYEITGGILTAPLVDYSYDGLNRNTAYGLDTAGNRSDYTMTGVDAAMNRYTTVGADTWYYSPWGGLQSIAQTKTYTYDAQNRLKGYTEITPGTTASLGTLIPGTPPDWPLKVGDWEWNAGGGYLEETGATTGCLLRTLPAAAPGLTVEYLSTHDPDDPDGDTDTGEFRTDDYPPKFYAQILLAVDGSDAPDYPYLALRITPDQLALLEYNGTKINELDVIAVECAHDTWYTATAAFDDGIVTVTCISEAPGTPMATLSGTSDLLDTLGNETNTVGFTVGELADYHFRALEYVTAPNTTINDMEWDYDPYGRKIARTEYDGAGAVLSQTRYVYDGWQLVQEIDVLNGNTVLAEYVYGPGYIDDVIQSSRGGNTYYHHTDQQYSTVAVTDGSGTVVERYGYDAFGNPAIYDATGTALPASTINNPILYTGRIWQPELGLYDYRNRMYDPATGRFTTPDPLGTHGDWNNMGNAYTYVANNPGRYVDPYGEDLIDLFVTGQWNPNPDLWQASYAGFGLGASEGQIVVSDAATLGLNANLNAQAQAINADAQARGDIMSQVGFGLGAVGVEAGYAAVGGFAVSKVLTSGRGTAFLFKHATGVRRVTQVAAVAGSAYGGYNAGSVAIALSEHDYGQAVQHLGTAALSFVGSGFGAKTVPGKFGKGSLRIGKVVPPKNIPQKTTTFGNEMHARIGKHLQQRLNDPQKSVIYRLRPGQRGIDIEVPLELRGKLKFNYAEIKPQNPAGAAKLQKQIAKWGFDSKNVIPLTYRASGDVYIGF